MFQDALLLVQARLRAREETRLAHLEEECAETAGPEEVHGGNEQLTRVVRHDRLEGDLGTGEH